MDAEENQQQVSLRAHSLWKSLRDSHIPAAATSSGKVESQNQPSHFSTALRCTCVEDFKNQTRRPAARSSAPPFRLILRLENAPGKARIVDFHLTPQHTHADFIFDFVYGPFVFNGIQGRRNKAARLSFHIPAVRIRKDHGEISVPVFWFTNPAEKDNCWNAVREALDKFSSRTVATEVANA